MSHFTPVFGTFAGLLEPKAPASPTTPSESELRKLNERLVKSLREVLDIADEVPDYPRCNCRSCHYYGIQDDCEHLLVHLKRYEKARVENPLIVRRAREVLSDCLEN